MSACPTLQAALAPVGSPLFAYHPLLACRGYAPRKHRRSLALAAAVMLPSPQGTAGRLLHTCSISGLFLPFTDVPAYVLPVYASPCALPHPTQDSVPDCWLRFVRAAIADGWTICACKAQPPKNCSCKFPCMPLKPFKRSLRNAVVPHPTLGSGPACGSWGAGGHGSLWYPCPHVFARLYDGCAIR